MRNLKKLVLLFILLLLPVWVNGQITIEECIEKARENYPLIRRYAILDSFQDIDMSNINKTWLPKIGISGQITCQNVVPSYPEALKNVLQQMGQEVKGLSNFQYKLGIDMNQPIWDGGASAVKREIVKSKDEVSRATLEVELYALRERVENIYFSILLTEEHIAQANVTAKLLEANLLKIRNMLNNGVAMLADYDMMEAEYLTILQNIEEAENTKAGLCRLLEIYIGESLEGRSLILPNTTMEATAECMRPELTLYEKRELLNLLSNKITNVELKPKVGLFAQAYYGYPGFDYFKSMMKRSLSFNIMAGVKVSWNLDALYSKKNSLTANALNSEIIQTEKEVFLFNNRVASENQKYALEGIKKVMKEDARIVELRTNVRKAAESQLENGIIDATTLLSKISDENLAILNAKLHQIRYVQEIYKLKYILNK